MYSFNFKQFLLQVKKHETSIQSNNIVHRNNFTAYEHECKTVKLGREFSA